MLMLAMLGFTNFSRSLPLHDKLLHFMCFSLATGVFYFIFDVEEDARRIWFWRHSGLIFTAIVCFFFGGIVSEIVQSMLPYKTFDFGDIIANLLGSGMGLYAAYYMERYYRHRREISRLYRPLNTDYLSDSDEEDSAQLLPSHYIPTNVRPGGSKPNVTKPTHNNLNDVWDAREEFFDIGGDSDDEYTGGASGERGRPVAPKITISNADSEP